MEDASLSLLAAQTLWQRLLRHYVAQTRETAETTDPPGPASRGPRWAPRIAIGAEDVPADLTAAHGALIAHGWLMFQMEEGSLGLTYRASPAGQQALNSLTAAQPETAAA